MHTFNTDTVSNSLSALSKDDKLSMEQLDLMLSQEYDPETAGLLMRKLCLQSNSDDINKKGMEFLYMHGYFEDLQNLINKNKKSLNKSNQKWADIYQITIDRKLRRYPPDVLLSYAENFRTDEPELKCIIEFIKVTIYYGLDQFGKLGNFLEKQQHLFKEIDDRFLLSFFNQRLNHNLFAYYLVRNEVIIARKHAFRVLNQTTNPKTKVNIHTTLGLSYIFDTYFQGMFHMSEALKIAKDHQLESSRKIIEQFNIPFLSAHFKRVDGISSPDKSEQAHIEIAKGNYRKAEKILHEIDIDSPFKMYYLGVAKQDRSTLLQSYNYFIEKRSDYFFSRLPLNAMKAME
ncbi:AimR family lysis-lysogeny pheromone receptor [Virgibacillus siamensis]|uniref:AimR family lysis-lysogeny pheromone receptor n=1 Tax=Virgibacillus siamensis TaxID=480071 RepID=UPI00098605BA|nr:AimR family lysis-lysogeny pheromone receptor [Virgibacillus siamensis]